MPVRFGIIGIGVWAQEVHLPNLLAVEGTELKALCSRPEANRQAGAALCRERPLLFERVEELLACDEVDAVVVCTPNDLHASLTSQAIAAGRHVFCEKPLALSRDGARRVQEAAAESGRVLAVDFELRSSDVGAAAATVVRDGTIGAPLMITGSFRRGWGGFAAGWRTDPRRCGGVYAELFCHTADLLSFLVGERPASVYARAAAAGGAEHPDCTATIFQYPCGAVGAGLLCMQEIGAEEEHPFEIVGEDGRLVGRIVEGSLHLYRRDRDEPLDLSPRRDPSMAIHGFAGWLEAVQGFVDCIEGRRGPPAAGLAEGLAALELAEAIRQSVAEGRPVPLDAP